MKSILVLLVGVTAWTASCADGHASSSASGSSPGSPPAPAADATQATIDLGRLLFFEERLSVPRGMACATCHDPARGWSDDRPQGKGVQDHTLDSAGHDDHLAVAGNRFKTILTDRNTPSIYNSFLFPNQFWDKRAGDLVHQANFPTEGFNEMNSSWEDHILPFLASDPGYVAAFEAAYGPGAITQANAVDAIGVYEATITAFDTPFDQYLAGDLTAMTQEQIDGKDLFFGKAGCFNCHPTPMLTDFSQHNTGVPNAGQLALAGEIDFGFGKRLDLTQDPPVQHDDKQDYAKFKTPQLRMLKVTGPYMHNGAIATLEDVVDFYDAGGGPDLSGEATKSGLLAPLNLTQSEKQALVAFLRDGLFGSEIQ